MPHLHDAIDFTVDVFVVYKDKVLLRKHDKYKMWLSVGGHIELGEGPEEAAIREVKEEVGLDVVIDDSLKPSYGPTDYAELIPPYYLNKHRINATHEHISFIYFAKSITDKIVQGEHEVSEACRWFTREEIEEHKELSPTIKFYALKALEAISK